MDELQISGKRFVSARRIAREHGYTSDYIGQLIRGGKITGQKVGRAWYVDAATFDIYLGKEALASNKVLQQKTPEQRSSDLLASPETPSGPVEARPFAQNFSASTAEDVVAEPAVEIKKENPALVVIETKKEEAIHIPLRVFKKEGSVPAVRAEGLRYYADDAPALPEITPLKEESRMSDRQTRSFVHPHKNYAPSASRRVSLLAAGSIAVVGIVVFIFSALVSSTMTLNISIEAGNAAATSYGIDW